MLDIDWNALTLAQEGAAPVAETDAAAPGADGTPITAPTGNSSGSPGFGNTMILVVVLLFVFIMFSFMGQRRDRKKRQAMLGSIKKHDRVQTIGGVIGSIVELKADTVVLRVDETTNTRITFARSAIQQVLSSAPEPSAAPAGPQPRTAE